MDEHANLTELALRRARDHRDDMARWLALEVLMTDEIALKDNVLQERLIGLQDKIEQRCARSRERERYGDSQARQASWLPGRRERACPAGENAEPRCP